MSAAMKTDRLVLTFNYKDGTRTITLDDVKEAAKANTGSEQMPGGHLLGAAGQRPLLDSLESRQQ